MGGIPVTIQGEVLADEKDTKVTGLYAAGECACVSVHGANRLGTNSLEASLFGRRAGQACNKFLTERRDDAKPAFPAGLTAEIEQEVQELLASDGDENAAALRSELQEAMMESCGIYREKTKLKACLAKVKELQERFQNVGLSDHGGVFNTEFNEAVETRNLLEFAEFIVEGALARQESRGAHSRTDFTARDDENWLKHTMAFKRDDGIELRFKPVIINDYQPQERKY